jgi:amino acid adenylation domain-containing protein
LVGFYIFSGCFILKASTWQLSVKCIRGKPLLIHTKSDLPKNFNLSYAVYLHSLSRPDSLAVASEGRELSYEQVAKSARSIAACIKQSSSWSRKDDKPPRVGVLASRSVDACLAVLGASWAGATYIPIGLKLPEDRILTVLSLGDLSALITDSQGAKLLSNRVLEACPPLVVVPDADQFQAQSRNEIEFHDINELPDAALSKPAEVAASDPAYIIFTSGTTGVPKGVTISSGSIRHYIEMVTSLLDLQGSDRSIETCELSFDVSVQNMFSTWQAGASLHVLPAVRAMSAVKFARDNQLTVWFSVPSLVGMLKQIKALSPNVLPNLRVTVFGGEQLPGNVVTAWQATAPNTIIENFYGPTEVTVFCLSQRVSTPLPVTPGRDFITIGVPMPGNEAAIVNDDCEFEATGITGELAIAGVQLSEGYFKAPELTEKRFPTIHGKRWYLTGDLAIQDSSGTFHCLGRIDNQVKVLGHRIELEEIDAYLRDIANASIVATVAWPVVDGMAKGLVSFVGAQSIDPQLIIATLKTKLPAYMVPTRVVALDNMPFNQSGKVDRGALSQLLEREVK